MSRRRQVFVKQDHDLVCDSVTDFKVLTQQTVCGVCRLKPRVTKASGLTATELLVLVTSPAEDPQTALMTSPRRKFCSRLNIKQLRYLSQPSEATTWDILLNAFFFFFLNGDENFLQ